MNGSVPYTTSELVDSVDRRVVDLARLGFPEIPVLGMNQTAHATEGSVFHRHRQCLEITLCVRGSAKFDCEGRVFTLMPGMVFVSNPRDVHRLRMNQRGARLYWMFLRLPEKGGTLLGLPSDETAQAIELLHHLPCRLFGVSEHVREAFVEMFAAYDDVAARQAVRSFRVRVAALRLLGELIGRPKRADEDVDRVFLTLIEKMRRHPQNDYGEDWLVEQTHLSPNTVLARFRQFTGLPPHAFLVKCRIHRAQELLRREGWSVTRVASELKFASSQHFATRFRQEVGLTPTAWRRVRENAK